MKYTWITQGSDALQLTGLLDPLNHSSAVMDASLAKVSGNKSSWKSLYDFNKKINWLSIKLNECRGRTKKERKIERQIGQRTKPKRWKNEWEKWW